MKLLSWIICLMLIQSAFCQTIDKLDTKKGFKDITLGDSYSKWQEELQYEGIYDDGSKAYHYIGPCCQKVFEYPVDSIILRFENDKLVVISITTKKIQKGYKESGVYSRWRADDLFSVESSFSYLFGKPTSYQSKEGKSDVSYIWDAKNVILITTYNYLGIDFGDRLKILLLDKFFLNSLKENGF
jgi:hypothetical protein